MAANSDIMRALVADRRCGSEGLAVHEEGPISVFAALLIDAETSEPEAGKYCLSGCSYPGMLTVLGDGRVERQSTWWHVSGMPFIGLTLCELPV